MHNPYEHNSVLNDNMRHTISLLSVLSALLSMSVVGFLGQSALAAPGDFVKQTKFDTNCASDIGVGVAFDGANLWFSCEASFTDLYRANPLTGVTTASYSIFQGIGAIAYDGVNNVIYTSPGNGNNTSTINKIQLDAAKNVVSVTPLFNATGLFGDGFLWDGLAFDAQDNTIYGGPDGKITIHQWFLNGTLVKEFPGRCNGADVTCPTPNGSSSGVAIGGANLYEGTNGASHVWVVKKSTINATFAGDDFFNFTTNQPGDVNFRDEGLTCDPVTFAANGTEVMWSKEAFTPNRASAFEIPPGSCGFGGLPPGPPPSVVGGEILPMDVTALFVAGAFGNFTWMVSAIGASAAALAIGVLRSRRHK